jgi:AraC-like DNA-binding protein
MPRYPWDLPVRMASYIEHGKMHEAHDALNRVLEIIANWPGGGLPVRKLRCAQVITICLRGAQRGGAPSDEIYLEHLETLERLSTARVWKAVSTLLHEYADALIRHVQQEHRTSLEEFIAWMRNDMRSGLAAPRSLTQYAEAAGISVGHLSRSFASVTGCTVRDERRRIRIEEAQKLLTETSMKIRTIAHHLGLKDPSQFVRDFRLQTGLTPARYRDTHQAQRRNVDSCR